MTALSIKMLEAVAPVVLFLALAIAFEILSPRERYAMRARFPTLLWIVVQPALFVLAAYPIMELWREIGVAPLIDLAPLGYLGSAVVMLLIFDFLRYFAHRAQHLVWWPVHAVHHSIRELHAAKSYAHPFEAVMEALVVLIPLSFIQTSPNVFLLVGAISGFQNLIIHSPIRAHMGPLRHVFVDSHFHRVHHSMEPQHHDRNFGFVFSFWDRLFGTYHPSGPHIWPETGVADVEPPASFRDYLLHPLKAFRAPGREQVRPTHE